MTKLIIRTFIKNYKNTEDVAVRASYGKLAGVLGIVCNALLFALKLCAGLLSGSMAVLSDAFNNLSDMGSSLVSIVGSAAAGRRADEDHPFGHGRSEYIASLIISFLIIIVGFELLKSSAGAIVENKHPAFSWLSVGVMGFSVLLKLWMFFFNRYAGKKINSPVLAAAAVDSASDVFATGAVLVSLFVGRLWQFPVDGVMGALVSVLIMLAGYRVAKNTITVLLGAPPDSALSETICRMVLEEDEVEGVHDLIIHDYGPGRRIASIHAEVSIDSDIVTIHDVIDRAEKRIEAETGVHIVIHMDPVDHDSYAESVKRFVLDTVHGVNSVFGIHDFRMAELDDAVELYFDVEMPYSITEEEQQEAVAAICTKLKEKDAKFRPVIQVDNKL